MVDIENCVVEKEERERKRNRKNERDKMERINKNKWIIRRTIFTKQINFQHEIWRTILSEYNWGKLGFCMDSG